MTNFSTVPRINRMTQAIVMGVKKSDFSFLDDNEREEWEIIAEQVEEIIANGQVVEIPSELT